MANLSRLFAAAGLSGNSIRGVADNVKPPAEVVADANIETVEKSIHKAADLVEQAIDLTGHAIETAVDAASNKAFESAANVGSNIATPPEAIQQGFTWGGYIQALGILCLLLAALWFAVWLLRRYGKFNFLPRPGSLPKDALVMEAQMPLGPKKGLMVVRFFNRRLLLGITDQQITFLTEENVQNDPQTNEFKNYLDHNSDN